MRSTKRRPATGEKRKTIQPLKIDRLGPEVHAILQSLKNERGLTWQEIEHLSAEKYDKNWSDRATWWKAKGGFVDWEELPTRVLEMFPDMRLPHSNLHRWYDLRVSQVTAETMRRSEIAQDLAASFAKANVAGDDLAVLNAARDQLMSLLAEDATAEARLKAARTLITLSEMQQERRLNDIKERQVAANERKLALLEEREALMRRKLEAEAEKATKKLKRGQLKPGDLADLVQRTFGIAPEAARK